MVSRTKIRNALLLSVAMLVVACVKDSSLSGGRDSLGDSSPKEVDTLDKRSEIISLESILSNPSIQHSLNVTVEGEIATFPLAKSMFFKKAFLDSCAGALTVENLLRCRLAFLGTHVETMGGFEVNAEIGSVLLRLGQAGREVNSWQEAEGISIESNKLLFNTPEGKWTADLSLAFYGLGITVPESPSGDALFNNVTIEKAGLMNKVKKTFSVGWSNSVNGGLVFLPYYNRETNYYAPNESNKPYHKIVRSSQTGQIIMASMGFPYLLYTTTPGNSNISFYRENGITSVRGYQTDAVTRGSATFNDVGMATVTEREDGSIEKIELQQSNRKIVYQMELGSGKFQRRIE